MWARHTNSFNIIRTWLETQQDWDSMEGWRGQTMRQISQQEKQKDKVIDNLPERQEWKEDEKRKRDRKWYIMVEMSPPSLSAPSLQSVSMTTLHPGPLQPVWQTQRQPLCSRVQRPCPLHRPGQPSEEVWSWKTCTLFVISQIVRDVVTNSQEKQIPLTTTSKSWVTGGGGGPVQEDRRTNSHKLFFFPMNNFFFIHICAGMNLSYTSMCTDTHRAHQCCNAPPPSQADRCRSRRGTGHVPRSVDGMLSGRTRRQSNPPHTDTGPLSRHHGCHMAPSKALSDREEKGQNTDIMSEW